MLAEEIVGLSMQVFIVLPIVLKLNLQEKGILPLGNIVKIKNSN